MNYFSLTIIRSLLYTLSCCLYQLQLAQEQGLKTQHNNSIQNGSLQNNNELTPQDSIQYTMEMTMTTDNPSIESSTTEATAVVDHPFDINTDVLARLADDVSIELMPELIQAFLTEVDTRLDSVKTTPLEDNENHIRTQVHSIKSCARTFGATELADKAAHIEQMIDAKVSNVESQIQQLLALLPAVHEAFNRYLVKLQHN